MEAKPLASHSQRVRLNWINVYYVMFIQGIYYIITGIWPLVNIDGFLAVTGPKTDLWLVKILAAVLMLIGFALLIGSVRRKLGPELALLGVGVSASLTIADIIYVIQGQVMPVYLADGFIQILLTAAWVYAIDRLRENGPVFSLSS